jgi:hypothetical protein
MPEMWFEVRWWPMISDTCYRLLVIKDISWAKATPTDFVQRSRGVKIASDRVEATWSTVPPGAWPAFGDRNHRLAFRAILMRLRLQTLSQSGRTMSGALYFTITRRGCEGHDS